MKSGVETPARAFDGDLQPGSIEEVHFASR
jgi:hypothetical protein